MKRITLSLIAVCLMSSMVLSAKDVNAINANEIALVQQKGGCYKHTSTPQHVTDKMVSKLGLNAKQAKKLLQLNEKYADLFVKNSGCNNSERQSCGMKGSCEKPCDTAEQKCEKAENKACCSAAGKGNCTSGCKKECTNECNKEAKSDCKSGSTACKRDDKQCQSGAQECKKDKPCEKRTAYNAELKKILTKAQFDKYMRR